MRRDEHGAIVDAVDLFYWPPGAGVAEYVRTIYDVPRNAAGRPQIALRDGDPTEGDYSAYASYGPENVVLPRGATTRAHSDRADGQEGEHDGDR